MKEKFIAANKSNNGSTEKKLFPPPWKHYPEYEMGSRRLIVFTWKLCVAGNET